MPADIAVVKSEDAAGSDRELTTRMAAGDERALAEFYDRFGNLCYSLAFQVMGNGADSQEVVSDVFAQVWSSAASFDPARASVSSWVSMITRSRALDRLRAQKRHSRVVELASPAGPGEVPSVVTVDPAADPAQRAEALDLRARIGRELARLPENQRQVIELAFYGGLTHSEIAAHLEQPLGTVKTRLRTAMTKLRDTLAAYQSLE